MDKNKAKQNLKEVLDKYNKYKNSDALEHEANAEKIIEEIFEKVLGWESLEGYVKRKSQKSGKFPDYTFRLNGINKFFLEAKKINADLNSITFQKQAIGYARSSSVSFAVLTNFVELRVYVVDREIDNSKNFDKSQLFEPILIENCLNEKEFERLWLLSKDSFINKEIYNFAESICKLPKRKEIGKHLSEKLNYLREKIKSNIKKNDRQNNKILVSEDSKILIDEVTQKVLDRIVFIRVCEDREFENRYLESFLNYYKEHKRDLWKSVKELFKDYDKKNEKTNVGGYDSGLFEPSLCDEVFLDDNILASIIEEFYYFDDGTPIDFSKIPADVLGNLYENYLTYISKNVDIQKSHKKEQGIFYTPTYIVDYIVRNTLGELLKDKKINSEKIKILDPACGSGSFLIKSFDIIEDYYKKKDNYNQKTLGDDGMTYSTKENILINNIFGVDLDAKAVEIAQLNLLLKIAEKGHKLPLLQKNIKRGNSLIDDRSIDKWAFEWEDNFKEGSFDIVIGNPPWVSIKGKQKSLDLSEEELNWLFKKYPCDQYRPNLFEMFIWKALSLVKEGGYFGFIVPDRLCYNGQFAKLREHILKNFTLKKLWFRPEFEGVISDNIIFIIKKEKANNKSNVEIAEYPSIEFKKIPQEVYTNLSDFSWFIVNEKILKVFEKIKQRKDVFELGTKFQTKVGFIAKPNKVSKIKQNDKQIKVFKGENILRFGVKGNYYFDFKKENLAGGTQDIEKLSRKNKVFLRKTGIDIMASFDNSGTYPEQSVYFIYTNNDKSEEELKVLCALLNSKLLNHYYRNFAVTNKDATPQLKKVDLDKFPIIMPKDMNFFSERVDKLISLNQTIIQLGGKAEESKENKDKINKIIEEIDRKVFEIYDDSEKDLT
jgi:type I restriction-modification system DNA methylase subunit